RRTRSALLAASILISLFPFIARAETGESAWLRYAPLNEADRAKYDSLPADVVELGDSPVMQSAQNEIIRGIKGMLGRTLRVEKVLPNESAIVLGAIASIHAADPDWQAPPALRAGGFLLSAARIRGVDCIVVAGADERGVLYGSFALLRKIALGDDLKVLDDREEPSAPLRWINQWDNINGTIERGYGGRSVFFDNGKVRDDLSRASEYARLLASLGINGCSVNNVNANIAMLDESFLPQLARIADAFRPWGVRLVLSVDVSSPQKLGGLATFDPLDPQVARWWASKVDQIYALIPDFAGFVVKADSEGRPGPSSYGRTPADAANVIARALKPHGGVLFYRAFVYDHHLDPTNMKADRARAAYDIFHPLDGKFEDNVVVQIKHGPIDFQVREPTSPLFGGLEKTNEAIELQITQEYMGQQRHMVFLVPMWKETLDFDMRINGANALVKDIISGREFHRPLGGYVGVANVGLDPDWMGSQLAQANLYGFGRLAWNPDLSAREIIDEWTRLTFGNDPSVTQTIDAMQLASWRTYENYTGPLGLQTLTDITGSHYGPNVAASEDNGWGQWHRADRKGVGMDRTIATGTGYVGQYPPEVQKQFETVAATPDDLLLFFHHVPYTYRLHSGKTVIQYLYDSHYTGEEQAANFVPQWKSLQNHIDDGRYAQILAQLEYQAAHAIVWRDSVCNYFLHLSGIPDAQDRVGHYPNRVEAESMKLQGDSIIDVEPAENASGGKAVACDTSADWCSASFRFARPAGWYELDVEYFDQNNGAAKYRVLAGEQIVDQWTANDHFPSRKIGGDTSIRRRIPGLALRPGDQIRIEGLPDGEEHAAFDYVEILSSPKD
ncbi:MAG TPA: alpha-glucuronidase family glycosyl hydrolase, partial [Candidatus Acidoferrales bacterium]|nr:alpha-glucuronidase family glycosyl hydrolase [Candidatus Acidoferrales bacterium]